MSQKKTFHSKVQFLGVNQISDLQLRNLWALAHGQSAVFLLGRNCIAALGGCQQSRGWFRLLRCPMTPEVSSTAGGSLDLARRLDLVGPERTSLASLLLSDGCASTSHQRCFQPLIMCLAPRYCRKHVLSPHLIAWPTCSAGDSCSLTCHYLQQGQCLEKLQGCCNCCVSELALSVSTNEQKRISKHKISNTERVFQDREKKP